MVEELVRNLEESLHKGFIDQRYHRSGSYRPKLLVNSEEKNMNVLTTLIHELDECESFIFSVAFITESGLAALKSHLLDLKRKGVKGRILTSTYLNFNKPKVFRELLKLENVDVRLTDVQGFHSKGYIFQHKGYFSLIVGSSNLTSHALKVNYEWNIKLTSHENGEILSHFKNHFDVLWNESHPLSRSWIDQYEEVYKQRTNTENDNRLAEWPLQYQVNPLEDALKITPNKMQEVALQEIQSLREAGKEKGLGNIRYRNRKNLFVCI